VASGQWSVVGRPPRRPARPSATGQQPQTADRCAPPRVILPTLPLLYLPTAPQVTKMPARSDAQIPVGVTPTATPGKTAAPAAVPAAAAPAAAAPAAAALTAAAEGPTAAPWWQGHSHVHAHAHGLGAGGSTGTRGGAAENVAAVAAEVAVAKRGWGGGGESTESKGAGDCSRPCLLQGGGGRVTQGAVEAEGAPGGQVRDTQPAL
jgi:hypothetical protein